MQTVVSSMMRWSFIDQNGEDFLLVSLIAALILELGLHVKSMTAPAGTTRGTNITLFTGRFQVPRDFGARGSYFCILMLV